MTEGTPRSWKYRRRCVFAALAFSFIIIGYLVVWGNDTGLHRSIADGLINVIWLTIATYVGGATADDFLKDKGRKDERP